MVRRWHAAMSDALVQPLRTALLGQIRRLTAVGGRRVDFTQPAGAPDWFDPESVRWRVHVDFVPMLVGGIRALLLQALHPQALAAGVGSLQSARRSENL
ncbi:hypothetical protein B1B_06749 [mine drainage metagenome]|uniref:ER-bound oxygenase mpaB/mpaB'/Rubber oxygenase catalytic domain-containing protein n=1 Tax=mine drainage metagenome TaxID=410659 RepID=T1CDP1_9ZZZZ